MSAGRKKKKLQFDWNRVESPEISQGMSSGFMSAGALSTGRLSIEGIAEAGNSNSGESDKWRRASTRDETRGSWRGV